MSYGGDSITLPGSPGGGSAGYGYARAYDAATNVVLPVNEDWEVIPIDTVQDDQYGCFDLATHSYIVPRSGIYDIKGQVQIANGGAALAAIGINGVLVCLGGLIAVSNSVNSASHVGDTRRLAADDQIQLFGSDDSGASHSIFLVNGQLSNYLAVIQAG